MVDYYKILRLKPGASVKEIKRAYHQYALHFHPDKNSEKGDLFLVVREAYDKLMELAGEKSPNMEKGNGAGEKGRKSRPHNVVSKPAKRAAHNLSFVKAKIEKQRPDFFRFRPQKVIIERNQCLLCKGYGVIENRFHQAVNCKECGGTGNRKNVNYEI
jgi:DnaJ-class molecular chaperone